MANPPRSGKTNHPRYTEFAETLPVIVWTAEPDGAVDYASRDFRRITGLDESGLENGGWLDAVHPDDHERVIRVWTQKVELGDDYEIEFRLRDTATGGYRWHLVQACPSRNSANKIVKWYGAAIDIHDRKLAETALQRSQEQGRLLLESSGEGIHGIDADGRVIFENETALATLGYRRDEITGQKSHELIHHHRADGSDYPITECPIHRTLTDGKTRYRDDEVFFDKDGTPVPVAYTVAAMIDPDSGKVTGAVVNFRDITANRQQTKLAALEAEVLDRISAGDSLVQVFNQVIRSVEDILPHALASILLVEHGRLRHGAAPSLPEAYNRAVDGLSIGPATGSCGVAAWRGEPVIVSDIATDALWADYRVLATEHGLGACWSIPIKDAEGTVLATFAIYYRAPRAPEPAERAIIDRIARFVGMAIERTRHMERLRESEERFRLVSQATSDVIWDWQLEDDVVWWSEGLKTRFGHEFESLSNGLESWDRLIHPDDRQRVAQGIRAAIEHGQSQWQDEYRFARADGSYALVTNRGYTIFDADDRPVRMVGSLVDVTDIRQLEKQLHQAQRLEAVGQLTGGIAHDFNNLLTVILGNAEMLEESLDDDSGLVQLAGMIRNAAGRGAELTNRLLAFARRQTLDPEPVDVNDMIAGLDHLLRRTLGEDIELEIIRDKDPGPALADAAQLESALLNLCLNARDAMPEGGKLSIEMANVTLDDNRTVGAADVESGQYVMVAVSDTGVGMDDETLTQAFEPFFTTKDNSKGSGLGLSMVYGYARQSNGHVHIDSAPGRGTTVRMYLPQAESQARKSEKVEMESHPEGRARNERILVVEDNDMVRRHVEQQLIHLGYRVVCAADGAEALEIFRKDGAFNLLLTDVIMPGAMSGRELSDRVNEIDPDLPVLYTSGYTEDAIVQDGRLERGVQLLRKPYRREELAAKVRKALDGI